MSAVDEPPRFWGPALGLMALFAIIGPLVGALSFWPLLFAFAPPNVDPGAAHLGWFALFFGHAFVLFVAYVLGFGPAAGSGFLIALYDRFGGRVLPRSLVAALIGAALTLALFYRLAMIGGYVDASVRVEIDDDLNTWAGGLVGESFDEALRNAFVLSGAIAAFASSLVASTLSLRADAREAA